jgi:hypothetical protein
MSCIFTFWVIADVPIEQPSQLGRVGRMKFIRDSRGEGKQGDSVSGLDTQTERGNLQFVCSDFFVGE